MKIFCLKQIEKTPCLIYLEMKKKIKISLIVRVLISIMGFIQII